MRKTSATKEWQNWSRTEKCSPVLTVAPQNVEQVQAIVKRALETGHSVKPIGASHSFTAIGATDGIRVSLEHMRGLISHDLARKRVTLWAGTHLWELPTILDPLGLALPNMGDIDAQTISGATQTGTHGTGLQFGGLATMITEVTFVDGAANVVTVGENDPELLNAVALGLGSIGIVVSMTLQCVSSFLLRAVEAPAKLDDVLNRYLELSRPSDHFEFYWFPHTKTVRTKTNTRLADLAELEPLPKLSRWLDEEFVNNDLLGAVLNFTHKFPGSIPRINNLIESVSSRRTYTDRSYKVYVTSRRVRFKETEFAIPVEAIPDAMREINRVIERKRFKISFPIEVRNAKADKLLLSTAYGRETGYIALHRFYKDAEKDYFEAVWQVLRSFEGRPHWGKMNDFNDADVRGSYPEFENFLDVRTKFDPDRVFTNTYLERVLGE